MANIRKVMQGYLERGISVANKTEARALNRKLEKTNVVRWREGEKPTEFEPNFYPCYYQAVDQLDDNIYDPSEVIQFGYGDSVFRQSKDPAVRATTVIRKIAELT